MPPTFPEGEGVSRRLTDEAFLAPGHRLLITLRPCAGRPRWKPPSTPPRAGYSLGPPRPAYPAGNLQALPHAPGAASAHQHLITPRMRRGQHLPGQYSAIHCRPGVPPLGVSTDYLATNAHY